MAGDELPEPVAEKTASHEAIDLQAINSSISTESLKEQMETKSNVLNVNIVNEDGDIVKEEVPYKLGISEQNPECLEKSTVNLEQEVPKSEENSSRIEKPDSEEQDKVNGETENELQSTQFSEELSPEVVKGDEIPPNGIPLLLEEVQEKTNSEEVREKVHQNQISDEDETEKEAIQSSSVATLSKNDYQKELEIPIGIASKNPEDVSNEVDVPSCTIPLVADEVLEEPNGNNDVSEEAQEEQILQIETPKEDLAEEKECRDETEDQCKDVPLAASLEETILEETSQENQIPEMSCEEIEQNEETALINKRDETSRIDNEETIPDEVSTSYDQSTANEETRKRDEGSEHMSEDIKVDDVAETATPLILEVAKGSADIKEDATEEAHKNQISDEVGTEKDASQSTSGIELSESDDQNETVKAIENESTNLEEEDTKELDLKEDESPSSVQDEILEEAKETADMVELQNEQHFEEVKPTEDDIAMVEKEETMQNENEENAEDLTSSRQDITNEETGKTNGETEHITDESTLETVTTRDFAPEIDIKDAEIKTLTSETDNRNIEKIEEENEEISVEVGPSESSDAPMKIEEVSLNKCKEEKSEEHEKLEHQEIDEGQEAESCLEIKEQLDESKPSPSEEEKNTVETKPLNETEEGEDNLAQSEIPSESKEKNSEDEEETCDEKSVEVSEIPIHEENDVNKDTDGDQLVEVKGPDDEAVKGNKVEIPESTEASNDTGALIDTKIASEKVELQSENTFSSQLTTSEEVLPEVPSESTTISEMEKVDKSNEVLDSKTENMEIESSHDDDPNKNSEAAGSAEVTEAPKEDLQDRTSEGSYEQGQVVPEKQTDEADLTISTYGNEIKTEKPEIANASSQGPEENSVILQKDYESVLEVQPEEETKAETLEILLPEKATEEDSLTIASKDDEVETEKPETGEPLSQGQDDKTVILNDAELVLEVKPEEDTNVEILETEQITQTLEEVNEPCITQNKEVLPEAENEIKSKETSTNSSISTIQQEQQSEESDAKPTEANQTTNISEEEGMETNATLISGIEQIDERSIAKEEEVTIQVENTVVETPDEETKGKIEKQIEEIPQIASPSEVIEVELGQSETVAPVTENFEVISNEISGDDIKFTNLDTESAELGSPTDESFPQKETSIETSNAREFQIDSTGFATERDQANQESDVKLTEPDHVADEVFGVKNFEDNAKLSETVEQIGEVEGLVANNGKNTNKVILKNDDGLESEVKDEKETIDETQTNEEIAQKLEVDEEPCITQNKEELLEAENTIENKETSTDSSISTLLGDQQSEKSDVKPRDAKQATDAISEEECLEINVTLTSSLEEINEISIAKEGEITTQEENNVFETIKEEAEGESAGNQTETCVEQIDERAIMKEQEATIQEQNIVVETQKGEAGEESTEEKMEEISEITGPTDITEIEISHSEIVAPETENVEVVSNKKFDDERKSTETDTKSGDLESTTGESTEQKEISTELSNTREAQIEIENITVPDQLSQESDVKPIELDQVTDEVSAVIISEDNDILSSSAEKIGEVKESISKEESVNLQKEDDVVAKMPEEEAEKIEVANENQIEEENPQFTNPSEVTEVELSQGELVAPETENMKAASDDKFDAETELTDTFPKSAELESATDESPEQIESSTEPIHTREVQIDQTEITIEEDQFNLVSDTKPTEVDQDIDKVTEEDNSEVNATLSMTIEQTGDVEELFANKESVVLQKEDVVVKLPEEEADQKAEATYEKHIEEVPQIVHSSEVTEDQLVDSEPVGGEAEHSEIISYQKLGGESELGETGLGSDQMETVVEKAIVDLSSSVEQITERSEENEGLLKITGEQVQGEKTDAIEVVGEPIDKHIDGEFHKTADSEIYDTTNDELKTILTEKEVIIPVFETQAELPEQEKETEESVLVEEKSDTVTLVSGEGQIEETESADKEGSVLPQSTTELPEQKVSQGVETHEEPSDKDIAGEISEIIHPNEITEVQLVEGETLHPETEKSEFVSNDTLGDENKLDETVVKLAQMGSTSDELREENFDANLSSSGEHICEKSEETKVVLQSTHQLVQGEKIDAKVPKEETCEGIEIAEDPCDKYIGEKPDGEMLKEEGSQGNEVAEDPCDKRIEGEIHRTAGPEICYVVEELKDILTKEEVDNFGTGTELTEKTTEESSSVDEKSDATASLVLDEEHIKVESANREISVVSQSTTELVAVPEERVPLENDIIEEQSDKDIAGEISKIADLETHDGAVQSEIMLNEEKVDSEELRTEIESPDLENATKESASVEEKSNDAANLVHGEEKIEEIETASKESRVSPQSSIESVTGQEENVSEGIEISEEQRDKHIVNEDEEAIEQTERDVDVTELLKAAEKVAVDETNEDSREIVPNLSEQSKEIEDEAKQSEVPEQDFASIVSSFLISKVLSDENQKVDDGMKQNNDASSIPKALDGKTIQEIVTTKTETEKEYEEVLYGTSSREEAKLQIQEPEEENGEKTVEENRAEDGVEHDYLPVSRFLMDKILRQEGNKNIQEEKAIEETDKHPVNDSGVQVEEKIEETDKDPVNVGGTQVEKKIEENSHIVLASEQKGELTSSFTELSRDFDKGETLMGKVESTFADGALFIKETVEENTVVAELTKLEGEGSHSPIELASDFEKEEKPAEAPKPIEDKNETLVSDVGISSVEEDDGENSSGVVVAEQEGESISPIEAIQDFEEENKSMEQKNEALITDERISSIEKIEENTGDVALPKQEKTLYPGEVVRAFDEDKKPVEEKDDTMVCFDEVKEGGDSKVALEEVEDLAYREHSKDLIEGALMNVHEISRPKELSEENRIVVEGEHKKEVIVDEETPKDVKNVEENYVFVEHEANQFEEPKAILQEKKVTDEASGATIFNLQEKETNLSAGIQSEKTNLVGQVESSEKSMKNSSLGCQDIEQHPSDIPKVPMATEIVKELVGNETEFIHGEERVKEVTDTVVDSTANRSQEKQAEIDGIIIEKKGEDIKSEEHEEEEEDEEKESHQERETEIIGRDLTVKAEAKETEMKSAQKKSHNILSGVGSKVKHSFAKVKKAISGKSKNVTPSTK